MEEYQSKAAAARTRAATRKANAAEWEIELAKRREKQAELEAAGLLRGLDLSAAARARRPEMDGIIWNALEGTGPAVATAIATLAKEPDVYVRGGRLCRLVAGAEPGSKITADFDRDSLEARISARIHFAVERIVPEKNDRQEHVGIFPVDLPPIWLTKGVLASEEYPGVRPLRSITPHPFLRPDGSVCDSEGYDPATECYCTYSGPRFDWRDVDGRIASGPDAPVRVARWALGEIGQHLAGYKWESMTALWAWVGALATGIARPGLPTAPGFVIAAPIKGASKSTLAFAIERLLTGRPESASGMAGKTEFGKAIIATLSHAW